MKAKTIIILAAAVSIFVSRECIAVWGVETVSKDAIEKFAAEFRAIPAGPKDVRVEFEFSVAGALQGYSRVDLRIGNDGDMGVTATLKEDRPKDGRVAVSFAASRDYLDKIRLWVFVPESHGGSIYEFRVKDFVDLKNVK